MLERKPKREKCEERDRQLAREREIPCRHLFLCVSVSVSKTHLQNKKYSRILNETITQRRKTGISAMKEIRKKITHSQIVVTSCAGAQSEERVRSAIFKIRKLFAPSKLTCALCRCMHIYLLKVTKMLCARFDRRKHAHRTHRDDRLTITHASHWPTKDSRKRQHMNEIPQTDTRTQTHIHTLTRSMLMLARLEATCVYTLYYRTFTQV